MITGSCLCSGVRYEAEGPVTHVGRCHCTQCRKASGAEFATNGNVPSATFRIVAGEELLRHFEWSPEEQRVFCGRCGSPLYKRSPRRPDHIRLRLGSLDTEIDARPQGHVFVSEKPAWSEITDGLPQHATAPGRPR